MNWTTENPDPNFDLERLVSTVKWARYEHDQGLASPEYTSMWLQSAYLAETPCGTAACVAGRCALDAGYLPSQAYASTFVRWMEGCPLDADREGDVSVSDLAIALFGITLEEGLRLFQGDNRIEDVEHHARNIAHQHGYAWPQ